MAYEIKRTDGSNLTTIEDTKIDISTSLTLIGKYAIDYGKILNENFVKLLENFSNETAPDKPSEGQLWYDKTNDRLNVFVKTGTYNDWRAITNIQTKSSDPAGAQIGDVYWNTNDKQLKFRDSSLSWVNIGPSTELGGTGTGIIRKTYTDSVSANKNLGNVLVDSTLVAVINPTSAQINMSSPVDGLQAFYPGINFTSTVEGGVINTPKFRLGIINGNVQVISRYASPGAQGIVFTVSPSSNDAQRINGLVIDGTTGQVTVASNATASMGITTKSYVDNLVDSANIKLNQFVIDSNNAQTTFTVDSINSANTKMRAFVMDRTAVTAITSVNVQADDNGLTTTGGPITSGVGTIKIGGALFAGNGGTGRKKYSPGDIIYSASTNPEQLANLAIGQSGNILQSDGTQPTWIEPSKITTGLTSNIAGGAANTIVYQSKTSYTRFLPIGTEGQVLTVDDSGGIKWSTISSSSGSVSLNDDLATNSTMYPLFSQSTSSPITSVKISSNKLKYNPSTGNLTAVKFTGSGEGLTSLPAGQLAGTIPSTVLENSSIKIGSTAIALNRSANDPLTLQGVSISGSAGSAATATRADNLTGSTINVIPYQSGANDTSFLPAGSSGQVLLSQGSAQSPQWGDPGVDHGGTGNTLVGPRGTVAYSTGVKYAFTDSAGLSGQVLSSQGPNNKPVWINQNPGTVTSVKLSMPTDLFDVTTNEVTGSGTLTVAYKTNGVLAESRGGTGANTLEGAGIVTTASSAPQTIQSVKTFDAGAVINNGLTLGTALTIGNGGTGNTVVGPTGSLAYSNGTRYAFLNVGTSGQILKSQGAGNLPVWTNLGTLDVVTKTDNQDITSSKGFGTTNGASSIRVKVKGFGTTYDTSSAAFYDGSNNVVFKVHDDGLIVTSAINKGPYNRVNEWVNGVRVLGVSANGAFLSGPFDYDLSGDGYQKLPSGLTLQFGTITVPGNYRYVDITFPLAFPSSMKGIWATYQLSSASNPPGGVYANFHNITRTGARLYSFGYNGYDFGPTTYRWFAIGN